MRILMLGPFPSSPTAIDGGVAAATTYLARALVCQPNTELVGVRLAPAGASAGSRDEFDWQIVDLPLDKFSVTTLFARQRMIFRSLIRRYQPDIVHAQGADLAGLLAVRSGRPSVVTIHGLLSECARLQTRPLIRARARLSAYMTERSTVRQATDLIAISPYVCKYYGPQIKGKVHDIPNPVSLGFFDVRRTPERGSFLFAGRIAKGKGVVELVNAFARCGDNARRLVLAGASPDPEYRAQVVLAARRLRVDDRVIFSGLLDEAALLAEFAKAEALVLPSFQETAPMVVQQAMAAGLPVIATRVGGVPYQISHDVTGLLFDPVDIGQLADMMLRLCADRALGSRLGSAARAVAESRFRAAQVAKKTREVYEDILDRRTGSDGSE